MLSLLLWIIFILCAFIFAGAMITISVTLAIDFLMWLRRGTVRIYRFILKVILWIYRKLRGNDAKD